MPYIKQKKIFYVNVEPTDSATAEQYVLDTIAKYRNKVQGE